MTTLEIAIKYGVPMPETCRELDWKGETFFYWQKYVNKNTKEDVWVLNCLKANNVSNNYDPYLLTSPKFEVVRSPQQHEIAPLLPLIVEKDKSKYFLDIQTLINGKQYLQYSDDEGFQQEEYCEYFCIQNHHYAEAYAQLYLKLKNENLL